MQSDAPKNSILINNNKVINKSVEVSSYCIYTHHETTRLSPPPLAYSTSYQIMLFVFYIFFFLFQFI